MLLVGAIHKFDHLNILVSGRICVATEFGVDTLTGHAVFESKAGTKKVGLVIDECIFMTVHKTSLTDEASIEEEQTTSDYTDKLEELT